MTQPGAGEPIVVAIDGAAGSGKSTLARGLARALKLPYLNTGLMYRALALLALERGVDPFDGDSLVGLLASLSFRLSSSADPSELEIQGRVPSSDLAGPRVEAVVSDVARHPGVRHGMVEIQRRLGAGGGVIEGRDIGSVVFPEATAKIFLEAPPEQRAARRADERDAFDPGAEDLVARALRRRDDRDSRTNPHVPAQGAILISTAALDVEGVLERALTVVREALAGRDAAAPPGRDSESEEGS